MSNYHIGCQEILITVHLNPLKLKIKNTLYSNRGFLVFFSFKEEIRLREPVEQFQNSWGLLL